MSAWPLLKHFTLFFLFVCLVCGPAAGSVSQEVAPGTLALEGRDDLAEADRDFQQAMDIWGNGKSSEAESLLRAALAIRERVLGPKSPEVAEVLERLGALDYNRDDNAAAEKLFRRAVEIDTAAFGERNMATSIAMGDLGAAIREQGRYEEAEAIVLRSVATRRALLSPNDPRIAGNLDNLARIYYGERRFSDARTALEEKLRIDQGAVRPDDQLVAYDRDFIQRTIKAEEPAQSVGRAAIIAMVSSLLLAGVIVSSEKRSRDGVPAGLRLGMFVAGSLALVGTFINAVYLGVFALRWLAGSALFTSNIAPSAFRNIAVLGAFVALAVSSVFVQVLTNAGRNLAGLPPRRISLFPRVYHPPATQPDAVSDAERDQDNRAPWFAAMEYYALVLNRTFKVFITPDVLAGAYVRDLVANPAGPFPAMQDQTYWVNTRAAKDYDRLDPASAGFLRANPSNFQIPWESLAKLTYLPGKKWGMGNVPHSGRLVLRLKSGTSRELILLGQQDGAALKQQLEKMISANREPVGG